MSRLKSKTFQWPVVPCVVIVSGLAQSSSLKNILSPWLRRRRWKHSVWLMRSSYIYLLQCVFDWFWHTHSTLGFIRKPCTGTTEPHILPSNGCILTHTCMYHSMCVYVCFFCGSPTCQPLIDYTYFSLAFALNLRFKFC